jgi:type IV pilus assembly protein PilV
MRGFTLLELMIAICILAVGLLAAATMQSIAMNSNTYANRISVATMVGQQVAEDISSHKITDTLLTTASLPNTTYDRMFDPATNTATASTVSIAGAGTFQAKYTIEPNYLLTGTTKITVMVFYIGVGGSTSTSVVTFVTYKMVV